MSVLKIKRTDVRRKGGVKSFFKVVFVAVLLIFLFLIGFFAASYFTEVFS